MVSLSQRKSALRTTKTLIPSFRELSRRYANPFPRSFPLGSPRVDLVSVSLHESNVLPTTLLCYDGGANSISQESLAALHSPPTSPFTTMYAHRRALIPYDRSKLAPLVRRQIRSRDLAPLLIKALAQSHPSLLFLPMTDHLWLCSPCLSRRHLLPRRGVLEPPRR